MTRKTKSKPKFIYKGSSAVGVNEYLEYKSVYKAECEENFEKEDFEIWLQDTLAQEYEYLKEEVFNSELSTLDEEIIVYAELGLWNGKKTGYKELETGLEGIFNGELTEITNDIQIYVEDGDIEILAPHHDGVNYYTVRAWKKTIAEARREKVKEKILEDMNYHDTYRPFYEATKPMGDVLLKALGI